MVKSKYPFDKRRALFALRIRQVIINDSKSIPDFRKRLEEEAERLFKEWGDSRG